MKSILASKHDSRNNLNSKVKKKHLLWLVALLVAAGLVVLLYSTPPQQWDSAKRLGEFIDSLGAAGIFIFLLIGAAATAVGLPRQFFAFAAGFSFGVIGGVVLSSIGAIAGCALTYSVSRKWLANYVYKRFPSAVDSLNKLIEKDAFFKIVVLRMQPLGTNFLTNVCAGVTTISPGLFLSSSWLGYLPQMMVFSLLGAGVRIGSSTYMIYSMLMLVISVAIGVWLYRRHMLGQPMSGQQNT